MADLRITDAPEKNQEELTGEEKVPTGGTGNFSVSLDSIAGFTKTKEGLADNASVDGKVNGVRQILDNHIDDLINPHQVTKDQVGLGNVDNTADLDKPVSNSTQAAIITATQNKAEKSYVDSKTHSSLVGRNVSGAHNTQSISNNNGESQQQINDYIGTNWYAKVGGYALGDRVRLLTCEIVQSTVNANTNNPNIDMTGWVYDASNVGAKPSDISQPDSTVSGVNSNVYIGGYGSYNALDETKVRTTWDATNLSNQPTVAGNSLKLTGNFISPTANSSIILGGRPSYYSRVIEKGALTFTYGGDNSNGHLAGVVLGYHCDLFSDPNGVGSHGCIVGGSYKQSSGDYSGSFAGTVHQVYALSSVALGGSQIKLGTLADATLSRRCATVGGYMINLVSGLESAVIGGNTCSLTNSNRSGIYTSEQSTITSANNAAIVGGFSNTISANSTRSTIVGGARNTVSAQHAQVLNGTDNIASATYSTAFGFNTLSDTYGAIARSSGMFTTRGDSQVYDLTLRRAGSGTSVYLSLDGGGTLDAYTVKSNQVGMFNLNITGVNTDTKDTWCFNLLASFSTMSGALVIKDNKLTVVHEDVVGVTASIVSAASGSRVGILVSIPTAIESRWNASGTLTVQNL